MIPPNNEWALYSYEVGFNHGADLSISPPTNADPYYRIGFKTARNQ